ncbi:MAG: hypothetical protein AAGE98_10620 [Actinomycetota bacterium]
MDDFADLDAPADVVATIEWLLADGFEITRLLTRNQANGNKLVELRSRARQCEVVIVRDRGQWSLDLHRERLVGTGLATMHEARTGEVFEHRPGSPLPRQHPADQLAWADAVPAFFRWTEAEPAWQERLDVARQAGRERMARLLGPS